MVENSSKPWTSEEEDRLRALVIANAAAFDIAAELGRTVSAVKGRSTLLRLTPKCLQSSRSTSREEPGQEMCRSHRVKRSWSKHEVGQLKELARNNSVEQIAKLLNRSPGSVKLKAYWLNRH
jgi:IS30 family transposase